MITDIDLLICHDDPDELVSEIIAVTFDQMHIISLLHTGKVFLTYRVTQVTVYSVFKIKFLIHVMYLSVAYRNGDNDI